MLDEIHIQNVALIEDTFFEPSSGFTVITGETGAGKTALLNAIKLLVGERSSASYIREGCGELQVEGRFYTASKNSFSEEDSETLPEDEERDYIVKRRITDKGRSKAYLNGEIASAKDLAEVIGITVDLCGQHEHQHLLKPAYQRDCLDAWGSIQDQLLQYENAYLACKVAQKDLDDLIARNENNQIELDRARFVVEQIANVDPQPGEYEILIEEMPRFEHGEMLAQQASKSINLLSDDRGVLSQVDELCSSVQTMANADSSLQNLVQTVNDAYFALEDVSSQLHSYQQSIDFSPAELEQRQVRISDLQALIRGYGPTMEQVFKTLEDSQTPIREHDSLDDLVAEKKSIVDECEKVLQTAADELASVRQEAAAKFAQEITQQMKLLNMGSSIVVPSFENLPREQWTKYGSQKFELLFAPSETMEPMALNHVASGGEISRVMLAIKVCLGSVDRIDTLVFDEIDAGVGGQTARALASVLKTLSKTHQVIVVTHLAQVAALGDTHYLVEKSNEGKLVTNLRKLDSDERVSEIARMLSGDTTEASLAHAKELLEEA